MNRTPNLKLDDSEQFNVYRSVQNRPTQKNKFIPRKGSVPLFKKLEVDFKKKEHDAVLNERKKALADLRELKKPVDYSEVMEHQQQYDELRQKKQNEIEMRR